MNLLMMDWTNFVDWVSGLKDNPWAWLIFLGVYAAGALVWPSVVFPIAGGMLFGFWRGLLLNLVAANLGAWIAFVAARKAGRAWIKRLLRDRTRRFRRFIPRGDMKSLLLMRLIGFPPFAMLNYGSGLSGMRPRDYGWGTLLGILPWTATLTYFSDTLWTILTKAGPAGLRSAIWDMSLPLLALAFLGAAGCWIGSRLKKTLS